MRQPTSIDYTTRIYHLLDWLRKMGVTPSDDESLDCAIADYFDSEFADGAASAGASKLLAAIAHICPCYSRHGAGHLPRALRAAQGWRRLAPARSRAPLPWAALIVMVGTALWQGRDELGLFLLLAFVMYPRPGELLSIKPSQLVPPIPAAGVYADQWGLILSPSQLGVAGKTGEFDESLLMDWPELRWMDPLLHALRRRPCQCSVWNFDADSLRRMFNQVVHLSGIENLKPVLYSLRHGGASHDILCRHRTIVEVKRRGRWRSDSSLNRYEKATFALAELAKMPDELIQYSLFIENNLAELFLDKRTRPPPPSMTAKQ